MMDLVPQLPEALLENHDVDGVVLGNEDLQLGLSVRCLGGGGGGLRRLGGSTLVCSVNHRLRDLNLWCLHTSHGVALSGKPRFSDFFCSLSPAWSVGAASRCDSPACDAPSVDRL